MVVLASIISIYVIGALLFAWVAGRLKWGDGFIVPLVATAWPILAIGLIMFSPLILFIFAVIYAYEGKIEW